MGPNFVYIVVRVDDLHIESKHLCFMYEIDAYKYALRKAHELEPGSNYEWKVLHVAVYEEDYEE